MIEGPHQGQPDPHILRERVSETAAVFRELGGIVTERIYAGLGHTGDRNRPGRDEGVTISDHGP